ncbi:MAG: hypothetical protein GX943_03310 [Candidatus Pacebacteria bacterium]|jgi:hypothetical protein|nr:hypothetical protein [Candidatus Paceibacterota bacterium]
MSKERRKTKSIEREAKQRYTLVIKGETIGGSSIKGLTEEEVRKKLLKIDPDKKLLAGRDYRVIER